jgi:hypothetical protein
LSTKGTLVWANQDAEDKNILFEVPNDELVQVDKAFELILENPDGTEEKKPRLGVKKADLLVVDDDQFGELAFASADYFVTENGGEFVVSVLRRNGLAESVSVDYEVVDGSARSGEDFIPTSGTLNFEPGQPSTTFSVTILNGNEFKDQNETVVLKLMNPKPLNDFERRAVLGTPNVAVLNIIDDELNNVPPGVQDTSFNQGAATDDFVDTVVIQADGKFIIGGEFTNVNGLNRSRIARLNANGQIDGSYNLGNGFDGPVRVIKIDDDGKALVAGYFNNFNGVSRNGIARLNADGVLDETFNPGGGADNPVTDLAIRLRFNPLTLVNSPPMINFPSAWMTTVSTKSSVAAPWLKEVSWTPGGTLFNSSSIMFNTATLGVPSTALRSKSFSGLGFISFRTTVSF